MPFCNGAVIDPEYMDSEQVGRIRRLGDILPSLVDKIEERMQDQDYAGLVMEDGDWVKP